MPLASVKPPCLSEFEPLSRHSSFKIGGCARFFAVPRAVQELKEALDFARSEHLPWHVLGGGCNTLFGDGEIPVVIISMLQMKKPPKAMSDGAIQVSAGFSLPQFGHTLRELELSGLEFLSQIPGMVGGAVFMNAGFSRKRDRSQSIGLCVKEVEVLAPDGQIKVLPKERLKFGYRSSNLEGYAILSTTFQLKKGRRQDIAREMQENYRYRLAVQDLRYPSAGSVFKNPTQVPWSVGEMVERLGLKGMRVGDAQISDRHGNFIVNMGSARSCEVLELIALIRRKVEQGFGIKLELEIRTVGCSES